MPDLWHFPREKLARDVMGMFGSGMSHALTFFAPRRKGKTEFLKYDLLPIAAGQGWKTLYHSFMEGDDSDKGPAFLNTLQAALTNTGLVSRALASVGTRIKGGIPGIGEGELSIGAGKDAASTASLSQLVGKLAEKGPTLLLLDEVQELAGREENKTLIAGLRTGLDMQKDKVKVVFTGSSREKLRRMFSSSTAPFFHFGASLPFPDLEREFVQHIAKAYALTTGRQLDEDRLWQAFIQFHRTPAYLREAVEQFVLNPIICFDDIIAAKLAAIPDERQYDELWAELNPQEQAILAGLAERPQRVYANEFRQRVGKCSNVGEITTSAMQVAINKLAARNLIFKDGASYAVEDELLRQWIVQQESNL